MICTGDILCMLYIFGWVSGIHPKTGLSRWSSCCVCFLSLSQWLISRQIWIQPCWKDSRNEEDSLKGKWVTQSVKEYFQTMNGTWGISERNRRFEFVQTTPLQNLPAAWNKTQVNKNIVIIGWVVVSNIMFYCYPNLGKIPILTNIFQLGWSHQLVGHRPILHQRCLYPAMCLQIAYNPGLAIKTHIFCYQLLHLKNTKSTDNISDLFDVETQELSKTPALFGRGFATFSRTRVGAAVFSFNSITWNFQNQEEIQDAGKTYIR